MKLWVVICKVIKIVIIIIFSRMSNKVEYSVDQLQYLL